ncbi:MAG: anti-sigma regulatory factor [Firmicutes bacterium HGW-Firmicutes-15]|nr:MAG: anti-sigma regulatory factor [Firmicutes bacterium HGW-Firmicutes-15]
MTGRDACEVSIDSENEMISVRKVIRNVATEMGFGVTDVTRIVTAASELTRNIFLYASSGTMIWRTCEVNGNTGIELIFEDHGPGIADIEEAMQAGFTTGGGLGLGLPGTKRLMDDMEIKSQKGEGTVITIRKYLRRC